MVTFDQFNASLLNQINFFKKNYHTDPKNYNKKILIFFFFFLWEIFFITKILTLSKKL